MSSTKHNAGSETTPQKPQESVPGTNSSETGSASPKTTSVAELVGNLMGGINRERSTARTAVVPSDSKKKTRARHDWLERIVARWEAASGITIPTERLVQIARELDDRNYPETIARLAEEWILRGDSVKYGRLTLTSFFPTEEQLASLDLHIDRILARERAVGQAEGFATGRIAAQDEISQNVAYIELLSRTSRIRKYAQRMAALRRREHDQDLLQRQLYSDSSANRRERARVARILADLTAYCCPHDRELIEKAIERMK
jgi:hypothetical protein